MDELLLTLINLNGPLKHKTVLLYTLSIILPLAPV